MFDLSLATLLHNPASLLLAGGGIAALTAGWSHVKEVFRTISGVLIVRAHFTDITAREVVYLLKTEFKRSSIGSGSFTEERVYREGGVIQVPYELVPKLTIFRRGSTFVFVSNWGCTTINVVSIRGFMNPQELVKEAVGNYNDRLRGAYNRRHWISTIKGKEKLAGGMSFGQGNANDQPVAYSGSERNIGQQKGSTPTIPTLLEPLQSVDHPLLFSLEELKDTEEDAFKGLSYEPHVLDEVDEAESWLQSAQWYRDRFIPWTLGWLLHGLPGSGKSSLAIAAARKLQIPVYNFVLSTLSNQEFIDAWEDVSAPCMILFEDFDAVFDGRTPLTEHKLLTFDCLINQISGTGQQDGVFLVVTTNDPSKLDSALGSVTEAGEGMTSRPGRIDTYIELNACSETAKKFIIGKILCDYSTAEQAEILAECEPSWTVVQVQSHCIKHVQKVLRQRRLKPTLNR